MRRLQACLASMGMLVGLSILACASAHRSVPSKPPASTEANEHWTQDTQLREIMAELKSFATVPWPQEVDSEKSLPESRRRQRFFFEAQQMADGLAAAADKIPGAVAHLKMAEADRRSFVTQSQTLRDQAIRLGQAAGTGDQNTMERELNAIDETCMSCHGRFREFSGSLDRR